MTELENLKEKYLFWKSIKDEVEVTEETISFSESLLDPYKIDDFYVRLDRAFGELEDALEKAFK